MLAIQGPSIDDILTRGIAIHAKPLGDLINPLRAESPLGIDVGDLPLGSALDLGKLADHRSGHRELRLARAKLTEYLGDAHGLEPTAQHRVEALATGGDATDFAADVA